ncbi:hypothetical protein MRS44_002563 [Fusarium solani]|uniref:uncharacterized protein n=1 Tax=Fusarium solani TaxID=169388 RepID=UPI0032C42FB2|nr:hypothetical protein MRS44_002563 [Fusarium solani]
MLCPHVSHRLFLENDVEAHDPVCEARMFQSWMECRHAKGPLTPHPPEICFAQSFGDSVRQWTRYIACTELIKFLGRSRSSHRRTCDCLNTCNCCNHQKKRDTEFYIRSNEAEFVRIQGSPKLLSIKSHVEIPGYGSFVRQQSWIDPPAEPPSINGWKRVNREISPVYKIWFPISITMVEKTPKCGYSKEIWFSSIGKPRPMCGSVIRRTSHYGICIIRRDRDLDLGELVLVIENPGGRLWSYCCALVCQGFERGKLVMEGLLWGNEIVEKLSEELD